MTVRVWWLQGDDERCVSRALTVSEAEALQRRLYALRDLHCDRRVAYDADFEIR